MATKTSLKTTAGSKTTPTKSTFNANMLSTKQKAELAKGGSFTNSRGEKVDGTGKVIGGTTTRTNTKTTPTTPTSTPKTTPKTTPTPANSYTGNSIVDYLKSSGGDTSFTSRAQLAVQQGIVANAAQYTGSAAQNTSLLTKLRSGAKTTPTAVTDAGTADAFINGAQDDDMAKADAEDAPPSRSESLLADFYTKTGITSLVPEFSGEAPDFEATYTKMRKEYGVEGLERTINEYDALEQDIQSRLRDRVDSEEGKAVAMNVISGRIGEAEKQEFRRLDEIGRAKNRAVNELQTANNVIETMMNLKQMDYTVAKDEYNREFTRNTQLFSIFKGLEEFDLSVEERDRAAAVSNLNILYGSIKDGGIDINTLDPAMEAKMSSLELKAGLPTGFYKNVASSNPEAKILSTTTRTSGNVKYADIIMQNPDGSFKTSSIKLGYDGSGASTKAETDDKEIKSFRGDAAALIEKLGMGEISWGAAFNSIKAKYPEASNELIDVTLNKNAYYEVR